MDYRKILPEKIIFEAELASRGEQIEEIRIRVGRPATLTVSGSGTILCTATVDRDEMAELVEKLCGGSLHAHEDTIKQGFMWTDDGCRVGLCGSADADPDTGKVRSVYDVSSICIRIPHGIRGVGTPLCELLESDGYSHGMLVFSPPGVGKTTLLRDIAITLSSYPRLKRVAVIDSRRELYIREMFEDSIADVFLGYPRGAGIEQAVRTMSPELVICDEIGADEADGILNAQNCGVPLAASAHASSFAELMRRPHIARLCDAGVFGFCVLVKRSGDGMSFEIRDLRDGMSEVLA